MPAVGTAAVLFAATALGSAALAWAWIGIAQRRALHDLPGPRRVHQSPTPRGGGIAIALAMLAALAWIAFSVAPGESWPLSLAAGIAAFAGAGLLDDLLPMPVLAKLALQLAAAALLLATAGGGLPAQTLAGFALLLGCAYFVNVWNFMDGSDGMVSVQALLIAIALAAWPGQGEGLRLAALALAGSCIGFLPFNFPRARVFLGDVGSHALGAAVFGLLWLSWRGGALSLAQALLVASVILIDTGLTLLRRIASGRAFWHAHREHLFQYAVRRGNSHARVAIAYGLATIAVIVAAWIGGQAGSNLVVPGLLMLACGLGTLLTLHLRRHWLDPRTHKDVTQMDARND